MAGVDLATAQTRLEMWLAAEEAVATRGQNYSIAGRSLGRADLSEIRKSIDYWQGRVDTLTRSTSGRRGPRYVVNE